jgi:putative ABC transport system permease protein
MVGTGAWMETAALDRFAGTATSGAFLAVDPRRIDDLYATLKHLPAVSSVAVRDAPRSFEQTISESFNISS